ncbi:MAG: hypothetical protein E7360_05245 [Clostridiales bacterium]|nr:hypothetical protein [Clostridiales bacterium]
MNNTFIIQNENFKLTLDFHVFKSDIEYPINTTICVYVVSAGFSASTIMEVDIKEVVNFYKALI